MPHSESRQSCEPRTDTLFVHLSQLSRGSHYFHRRYEHYEYLIINQYILFTGPGVVLLCGRGMVADIRVYYDVVSYFHLDPRLAL